MVRRRYSGENSAVKDVAARSTCAELRHAVLPAFGLGDAVADEGDQQGGRPAHREHGAPAVPRRRPRSSRSRRGKMPK